MGPLKAEEIRGITLRGCPRRSFITEADAVKPEELHNKDKDVGCFFCWKSTHYPFRNLSAIPC